LWIDEHHTSEDVSIAVGQVLTKLLEPYRLIVRGAAAEVGGSKVEVTADVCPTDRALRTILTLDNGQEKVGDLSMEMLEHVLNPAENAHMTVRNYCAAPEPNLRVQETVDAL
jgi:imidazoleglycerol-phosphate dehydratase